MPYNNTEIGNLGKVDEPELVKKRAARRAEFKEKFAKAYTDPHRHVKGEGGFPFEAAHLRYFSMKNSQRDFFKPNYLTARLYAMIIVFPVLSIGSVITYFRNETERQRRSGEIPYMERHPKFR